MKNFSLALALSRLVLIGSVSAFLLIAVVGVVRAAITFSFTITTTAQDTYIQATVIPMANAALCAKYGLSAACTSGQLTTAGCVPLALSALTARNLAYQNCTPFTLDATGENNMAADMVAKDTLALFTNAKSVALVSACNNFKALSAATQNTICASLGAPVPATTCDICN